MKKFLIAVVIVILVGVGYLVLFRNKPAGSITITNNLPGMSDNGGSSNGNTNNSPTTSNTNNSNTSSGQKFADSPYFNYAYLISSDTLTSEAQKAIAGFQLNKTSNTDGTTTIALKALSSDYHDQTYTLQPGQKLYFIETTFGDDRGSQEFSMGDDAAIVVDANGYIVQ